MNKDTFTIKNTFLLQCVCHNITYLTENAFPLAYFLNP